MLPNFTIVICGAVLTVMMLAVTGSGLITPETRTRIGEMPEVGRPMMQRMISEPAGQAQLAVLELSRRAEEIGRLRDLVSPALGSKPTPAVEESEPAQPVKKPAPAAADHADEPPVALAVAAAPVPVPEVVAVAAAPAPVPEVVVAEAAPAPPAALETHDSDKAVADPPNRGDASVDAVEAMIPGPGATPALANTEEVAPSVHLGARLNVRLPRTQTVAKAAASARRPVRHAVRRPHRHRSYAYYGGAANPFAQQRMQYR